MQTALIFNALSKEKPPRCRNNRREFYEKENLKTPNVETSGVQNHCYEKKHLFKALACEHYTALESYHMQRNKTLQPPL